VAVTTGFYLHPASPLHDTGWGHPEHQGRLRRLASTVGQAMVELHGVVEQRSGGEADESDLLRVHTRAHVERVRDAWEVARARSSLVTLDSDTVVSSASWEAAVGSAGSTIAAVRAVATGELHTAFVAARPPGHHATPDRAMGFCLFNSIAVAARWLQANGHAERVLIVDWDVHHGNGTQDIFYEDPSVYFLSLHQHPWYPGTGMATERGAGEGLGSTLNVPLPAGTPRAEYLRRFENAVAVATRDFRPDFVIVSSGFDSMAGDPLGGLLLEPEDMDRMTRHLIDVCGASCGGRIVAVLEGGYDPARLGDGTVAVIRALAGLPPA
jgi:acetoin utilization deacetylase AcuC-like enzyme